MREYPHRRPIYGIVLGWFYRRLGYTTETNLRIYPDKLGLPTVIKLVLQVKKEDEK